jgi:tRNA nucleotidyltransferase/poly(A) polymerase
MNLLREYIRELLAEQTGKPRRMPLDIPIPEDLKAIHRQMKSAGMQLFLVGGAVRDALMNKVPKDYDVATDATPEAVIELLQQDPELRIDLTGKAFGVVRVKTPAGEEYEIATFRKDIGKGRRPDAVEFTTIEDDVKRRDLTINALFYDMDTGEVVDYVGGIDDIKNGVIRAVGDPATRFDEDKLRILRTVRFAGRTGSDLDPATRDAILADNDLNEVSVERITEEFIKGIRSAQDITHFLSLLRDLGLFQQVLPGLKVDLTAGKTKDHVVQIAAMLANNDPNTVKAQLRKMKYSGADADAIKLLLDLQSLSRANAAKLKKEFRRIRLSPERIVGFAKLVDSISPKKAQGFISFAQSPPAANPRDLMAKGLKGPDVGKAMADAEGDAYDKLVKEVRKRVRQLLAEAAKGPADLPAGVFVEIIEKGDHAVFRYAYKEPWSDIPFESKSPSGKVTIAIPTHPCGDAWEVSISDVQSGWGPMLYDVAMEWASQNGGGLVSDRNSVSADARRVWDYYLTNRSDVQSAQLDDLQNTITPEEEDNCEQNAASEGNFDSKYKPIDFQKSSLSKRYTKAPTTMNALEAAGKLVIS